MTEKILYRLLIVTIYAGLVLAIFDPTSSTQTTKTQVATTPPAKSTPATPSHPPAQYLEHSLVAQSH